MSKTYLNPEELNAMAKILVPADIFDQRTARVIRNIVRKQKDHDEELIVVGQVKGLYIGFEQMPYLYAELTDAGENVLFEAETKII